MTICTFPNILAFCTLYFLIALKKQLAVIFRSILRHVCYSGTVALNVSTLYGFLSRQTVEKQTRRSHAVVGRSAAAFRHHPVDVLARVLDIAGLTVDTVLSVNLQSHPISSFQGNVLVHTCEGRSRQTVHQLENRRRVGKLTLWTYSFCST